MNRKPGLEECIHMAQRGSVFGIIHCIFSLVIHPLAFSFDSTSFTMGSSSPCTANLWSSSRHVLTPQWSLLLASCFICFSIQVSLPASNHSLQANLNSSIIIYSVRAFFTLVNPLCLLDSTILSFSNILSLRNHSRHTRYRKIISSVLLKL